MGDFRLLEDDRPIGDRKPVSVDKETFDDVMGRQNLSVSIVVPNRVSWNADEELPVTLTFARMSDFSPDAIATKLPELEKWLQIREALTWLRSSLGNRREVRERFEAYMKDPALRARLYQELEFAHAAES